jgi:putative ABC transport system permease protein
MALGADAANVRRLVFVESLGVVGFGAAIGLAGAVAAAGGLGSMFFGLVPLDPVSFVMATGSLLVLSLIAAYLPARHSARLDPLVALRRE